MCIRELLLLLSAVMFSLLLINMYIFREYLHDINIYLFTLDFGIVVLRALQVLNTISKIPFLPVCKILNVLSLVGFRTIIYYNNLINYFPYC
uniref:G_PROTEIN_RECEP_F1_2 domain-containing protein n=1 Tax=Heterorhabditis bacteriophora TaxID=37862 RepID=A0A1I7WBF1_HETBA